MAKAEIEIRNPSGLHARPAAKFVKLANRYSCDSWVEKDDEEINGKSIMGLMMLAASQGTVIRVSAEGEGADEALAKISELVNSGFETEP